jgi:hypothetical protein
MLSGISHSPPRHRIVDPCAEFTLRVAAIAQGVIPGATWPERWYLLPAIKDMSWEEAREHLERIPKPVVVTPLADPGYIGVWPSAPDDRAIAGHVANQVGFYDQKIPGLGFTDADTLILGTPSGEFVWSIGEFRRWLREYAVLARVVLSETTDPRVAQILVLGPERHKPPINTYRTLPPPRDCGCGHAHGEGHGHA